ncbi:hypothetical protein BJV78DRAFT_1233908 [Lactifluus subvellereus]|nr:hypothetical protein BJV78DRAFT_1233908 [Lactifluus subvellereus]
MRRTRRATCAIEHSAALHSVRDLECRMSCPVRSYGAQAVAHPAGDNRATIYGARSIQCCSV